MKVYLVVAHGRVVAAWIDEDGKGMDRAKATAVAHDGVVIAVDVAYDSRHGRAGELV